MASRGESKVQKSISVEKARFLPRKRNVFTTRVRAGAHSKQTSIPLGFIARDMLSAGDTMFETKKILNKGEILVNGRAQKENRFAVGLFDMIEVLPAGKKYRAVYDFKGRLVLNELGKKSTTEKISKIMFKKAVKNGVVQLTTSDGFVFLEKKTAFKPGDSLRFSLPDKKILEGIELKKGSAVFFTGGKQVGKTGVVTEITEGTKRREKLVDVDMEGTQVRTTEKNVVAVGKNSPAIEFGKSLNESEAQ